MRLVFKIAAACLALGIAYFSLQPAGNIPGPIHADKVQHFLAYGTLAFLGAVGWPRLHLARLVLIVTSFGIGVEIAQGLGGHGRMPSVLDAIANGVGASLLAIIVAYFRKSAPFRSA